jgi:general stress protein 26
MRKLADLIDAASIAMLTTEEVDGSLRSRPLATLQLDSAGRLWFFTGLSSGKVEEIDHHRKVNLSYANLDKQDYVSVSGHARLTQDREKMKQLWTRWVEPWFPKGLDDPDLALLEVTIDEAEYWDAPGESHATALRAHESARQWGYLRARRTREGASSAECVTARLTEYQSPFALTGFDKPSLWLVPERGLPVSE